MHIGVNALFLIPSEVGGTETILIETLRAIRIFDTSVRFTIFTNRENHSIFEGLSNELGNCGLKCLNFNASNRVSRILREQFQLPFSIESSRIDLLWSAGYTGPIACKVPHVVSIPDVQYESHPEDLNWIARIATRFLVETIAKRSDLVLTLSQFSRSEILKYYELSSEKVVVGYCGVNPAFANPSRPEHLEDRMNSLIQQSKPYLLCVSNSYPHKNIHTLVDAFRKIEDQIPHSLVLIGRKRLGEVKIEEAISKLKNPDRVVRLEYIPHLDLPWIYQKADLFVFPSLYEGFGLPVLEAMSVGSLIVATSQASVPEIVGHSATLVSGRNSDEFAQAVSNLLSLSSEERADRKNATRERARLFDWKQSAEAALYAFRSILNRSRVV